jgi:hypothetical protein|tara:strand:+ start:1106 stop:1612 length:507 start_codon:yes stop_codon:yes gene_type:complete
MRGQGMFLRWWLLFVLIMVGGVFAFLFDAHLHIYQKDVTKLSFLIIAIFSIMTCKCGFTTYKLVMFKSTKKSMKDIISASNVGWFFSDLCLNIGMIGTVVGFIMMLAGFAGADPSNTQSIQNLMNSMSSGMSTALYTTLVGLICSSLLKLQYFNIDNAINGLNDEDSE